MRVYIAGPLSGGDEGRSSGTVVTEYIQNCHRMIGAAVELRRGVWRWRLGV